MSHYLVLVIIANNCLLAILSKSPEIDRFGPARSPRSVGQKATLIKVLTTNPSLVESFFCQCHTLEVIFRRGCRGLRETKCRAAVVVKSENEVRSPGSPNSVSPELHSRVEDDLLPLKLQHLVIPSEKQFIRRCQSDCFLKCFCVGSPLGAVADKYVPQLCRWAPQVEEKKRYLQTRRIS